MTKATPATAGKFLTEDELRTFTKCSQLHFYGGRIDHDPVLQIVQYTWERIVIQGLRDNVYDVSFLLQKYAIEALRKLGLADNYEDGRLLEFKRKAILVLGDMFQVFNFKTYYPVFGPMEYTVRVSQTPVDLHISSIHRSTKNKTIHIVCFSPLGDEHALVNDPTVELKLQTLKHVVKPHVQRKTQAKLHIFGVSSVERRLLYSSLESGKGHKTRLRNIELIVQQLEQGFHFPILPCPFACRFKNRCYPEDK